MINFFIDSFLYKKHWNICNFNGDINLKKSWDVSDTEENYIQNGNKIYSIDDIIYETNKNGFRTSSETNEILKENSVACFGCSHTFGIGLPFQETWCNVLNKNLGDEWCVKNYGVSGASNDLIARLIHNYTKYNKPKVICCFLTDSYRMELFIGKQLVQSQQNFIIGYNDKEYHDAYKKLMTPEFAIHNFIKNYSFIESICASKNIKLYWLTWSLDIVNYIKMFEKYNIINIENYLKDVDVYNFENLPKARDNMHYGKEVNKQIADGFAKKILNNL
jgi:hypothetical protein